MTNLPVAILIPEIIANFFRFIYSAIDPIFFHRTFNVMTSNVFLDISLSISFFTAVLFGCFWWSVTGKMTGSKEKMLKRVTIFSSIYSALLFILLTFVSIIRGINLIEFNLNIVTVIIALVSTLVVAIIFI